MGDGAPDRVASLDVWYGLDSFEGALETGKDMGSKAKLLVRLWCKCDWCSPRDRFRISSSASGPSSPLDVGGSDASVLVCRVCAGSISWLTDANLTVCGKADSAGCALDGVCPVVALSPSPEDAHRISG